MASGLTSKRLWGHFEHSLDDKSRMIVPLRFRERLGDEYVLTTGPGKHIRAYPADVWTTMEDQIAGTDVSDEFNEDAALLQRMFGNCEFVAPDSQSRLTIPRHLREWANLRESEIAIILGAGNRLELWCRANWEKCAEDFTPEKAAQAAMRRKQGLVNGAVETRGDFIPTPL